jgi:hypothetical protein
VWSDFYAIIYRETSNNQCVSMYGEQHRCVCRSADVCVSTLHTCVKLDGVEYLETYQSQLAMLRVSSVILSVYIYIYRTAVFIKPYVII